MGLKQITQVIEMGVAQSGGNFRDITRAIAALAQENARARVSAASVTDLTDNSGGTDAGVLAAVVSPTVVTQDGSALLAPKAAFDTQIGLIEDAHRELLTKANELIADIVPGSSVRTVEDITAGAGADDTIAAISAALTGTTSAGSGVESSSGIAQITNARNNASSICAAVNWVRVAVGLSPITDGSGGAFTMTSTNYETSDAAATGAAAGAGESSLTEASVEAALTSLRNNIATMAQALTDANAPTIGPFVVATNNPNWKFVSGDTTV